MCRSMFVADRHFFLVDPARSLYHTAVYYVSVMAVNACVTVLNAGILLLVLYSMIGEHMPSFQLMLALQNSTRRHIKNFHCATI